MGKLKKFIYFSVLVDREEVSNLSSYDRSLVYASFIRQMLGSIFAFMVFFYAWSTLMPLWIAGLIAAILALIIFFLDQSIVGSEWTMHREISRHWALNGPLNFGAKIIQLLPRIAYAIAIAWFMATLAEIALQSRAIDRVLNETTRENNAEYFTKIDGMALEQKEELSRIDTKIEELEATILSRSDPSVAQTIALLETQAEGATKTISTLTSSSTTLQQKEQALLAELATLQSDQTQIQGEIAALEGSMHDEVYGAGRCRYPAGDERCKGRRWKALNARLIPKQDGLRILEADLRAKQQEVTAVQENLVRVLASIQKAQSQVSSATAELQQTQRTTSSISDLHTELAALITNREALLSDHAQAKNDLEQILISTGFRDFADYGPLDRRIGLQQLHDHPEYGAVARRFSWELKIVVILFELSPVLVTLFFTPFSFLSLRMREKRSEAIIASTSKRRLLSIKDTQSEADMTVQEVQIQTDADTSITTHNRSSDLQDATEKDQHDTELHELALKRFVRDEEFSTREREFLEKTGKTKTQEEDLELQELERKIHFEQRRAEYHSIRRKAAMAKWTVDSFENKHTNGGVHHD